MLLLFVIQSFLKKATMMEEFIPSKAEKKTLGCSCFEYFWSIHKLFWSLLLPSKRVQKNYHFALLIIY